MSNRHATKTDALLGTLDLMALQTLDTPGPLHGYAVAARLEQVSQGALRLDMGTLSPALMHLEQPGLLRGVSATTGRNRRARYHARTPAGRRQLEEHAWDRMAAVSHTVLRSEA